MRIRNIKNKKEILLGCSNYIADPTNYKGKWHDVFKNNNPINIEIGPGKCKFITTLALQNPNINYVAIEKIDTVLALGIRDKDVSMPNLRFINYDAFLIDEIFDKEIDTIYLNFSDPWPKKRHNKRRLTDRSFLTKYDKIFKSSKKIIQKTDNQSLFEYSIMELSAYYYVIEFITLDLQKAQINDNIMTEYEEKFSKKGSKIYMLKAVKK